jgi:tryptophan 2,3-dioxygenase
MDHKEQIVRAVHQIEELKALIAERWTMARKCIADGHQDDAIELLKRYFSLKTQLEKEETNLAGILHGYF